MSTSGKRGAQFWITPAVVLLAGVAYLVASWHSGNPGLGLILLAIMVASAVGIVVASRYSETVRGLLDRRDERLTGIDTAATATAGVVLVVAVVIAAIVELARGHSGEPYTWLGALGGVAYLVAVIVGRFRH